MENKNFKSEFIELEIKEEIITKYLDTLIKRFKTIDYKYDPYIIDNDDDFMVEEAPLRGRGREVEDEKGETRAFSSDEFVALAERALEEERRRERIKNK